MPRPFDVLLIDDTSRLSRNRAENPKAYEQLAYRGVRVVAVSQGIDTENEQAEVLVTVHELVDSLYIKELAKKTHAALKAARYGDSTREVAVIGMRISPSPKASAFGSTLRKQE